LKTPDRRPDRTTLDLCLWSAELRTVKSQLLPLFSHASVAVFLRTLSALMLAGKSAAG
jgi:hypothetical protein